MDTSYHFHEIKLTQHSFFYSQYIIGEKNINYVTSYSGIDLFLQAMF